VGSVLLTCCTLALVSQDESPISVLAAKIAMPFAAPVTKTTFPANSLFPFVSIVCSRLRFAPRDASKMSVR